MKISSKDFRDACEMADLAKFANTQKPVRPVLKLAYGKRGCSAERQCVWLNRMEKECRNG